jgi:hypothetical protein
MANDVPRLVRREYPARQFSMPGPKAGGRMRIYEGSPRQDWEEVLRAIGAFADREQFKELLLLELEGGFLLQGLALPAGGHDSDTFGALAKRTYELTDEQVAQLMDEAAARRGTSPTGEARAGLENYYEQAMRVVGAYIDAQKCRDVFLFEQDGSFVLRLLFATATGHIGHQLAEFTRDEILAMIEAAPSQRTGAEATAEARATGEAST